MDNNLQVDVIYTDLSKAFDRVQHCVLLNKLKYNGLCDNMLLLFMLFKYLFIDRNRHVEPRGQWRCTRLQFGAFTFYYIL